MKQVQFPVKLAYVMTFQKAHGQLFEKYGIYLNRSFWTHGQLYVVMSRCGAMSWVIIYANQAEFEEVNLPPNNHPWIWILHIPLIPNLLCFTH